MNARWNINEEKQLINDIANSKSYQELAPKYNRSANALELRIKKIVYDNITNNRTPEMIGGTLNLPIDKIKQYYYSYKEMLDKRNKPTLDIDFNNKNIEGGNNQINNKQITNKQITNKQITNKQITNKQITNKQINSIIENNDNNINLIGGDKKNKDEKLVNIIEQNETFKEVINNIKMRKKIIKLLKNGKLSPEMKDILTDILDN